MCSGCLANVNPGHRPDPVLFVDRIEGQNLTGNEPGPDELTECWFCQPLADGQISPHQLLGLSLSREHTLKSVLPNVAEGETGESRCVLEDPKRT